MAERESGRLMQEHQAAGTAKSLLQLDNGVKVIFEDINCPNGCSLGFETIEVNGEKIVMRLCKRPDGSICL